MRWLTCLYNAAEFVTKKVVNPVLFCGEAYERQTLGRGWNIGIITALGYLSGDRRGRRGRRSQHAERPA